jgi:predicted outer membrane repeat protein
MFTIAWNCSYDIADSYFSNNTADEMGGCIYTSKYKPELLNTTFDESNYAVYGPVIAGVPYGI